MIQATKTLKQYFHVSEIRSYELLNQIHTCDLFRNPGWVRMSIHPTMADEEAIFIIDSIESTAANFAEWTKDYHPDTNEYSFKGS